MSCLARFFIAIATVAFLLPGLATLAQVPLETDDPSPAIRHAQVIAQDVAPMPADEIAWRLTVDRAQPPTRAGAKERPAGFVLAAKGVVALVDQGGTRLARIAPGEATWTEPGIARAVIGLERRAPDYYDIALVPAAELAEGDPIVIGGAPFVAPSGDTFDVDLIRDVLNRAEESVVSTGPSPALLLVTSGTAFVESSSGLVEMTTGVAAQVAGDVVITGASRAPAAFVVARIGPEVPALAAAEATPSTATPAPMATPLTTEQSASVTISASLCPIGYAGRNDTMDCPTPAVGVGFNLMSDVVATATAQANEAGDISFTGIEPGHYTLGAERPADFATSRVRCRNASGDVLTTRTTTNQIAILLAAGDQLNCTWYLVPTENQSEMPTEPTAPPTATTTTEEEIDSDADGLTDELETTIGTDPSLPDSDADGVSDSDEIGFYGTDALDPDTDDDGFDDAEELLSYGTNPLLDDTDGDDVSDSEEVAVGSNPLDAASVPATPTPVPTSTPEPTVEPTPEPTPEATPATPVSTPDEAEALQPRQEPGTETETAMRSLPTDDLDGDGLSTADEVAIHGTNVTVADSDGDGVSDGDEVAAGTDPLDASDD